jgi:hypothetical protein
MPPTLKRIVWAGVPAAVLLAGVGFVLAEAADLFLAAQEPARAVEAIDGAAPPAPAPPAVTADVRRTLPLTMAAWGFALVTVYELLRWLIRGTPKPAGQPKKPVPATADVDKLLNDLLVKAEADRAGPSTATPPPAGTPAAPPVRQ